MKIELIFFVAFMLWWQAELQAQYSVDSCDIPKIYYQTYDTTNSIRNSLVKGDVEFVSFLDTSDLSEAMIDLIANNINFMSKVKNGRIINHLITEGVSVVFTYESGLYLTKLTTIKLKECYLQEFEFDTTGNIISLFRCNYAVGNSCVLKEFDQGKIIAETHLVPKRFFPKKVEANSFILKTNAIPVKEIVFDPDEKVLYEKIIEW